MIRLSRTQKILWAAAAIAVVLYAAFTLWIDEAIHSHRATESETAGAAIRPDFALTDHTGQVRMDEDFAGQWQLVFFGFTNCPDVCPTTLAVISQVMEELGRRADRVQPLFVSIDPERDTVEQMAEYVGNFHPSIVGLTGSPEEIARTTDNFRIYYEKVAQEGAPDGYTMSHTSAVYLISPEGRFVRPYRYGIAPDEILADLRPRLEG